MAKKNQKTFLLSIDGWGISAEKRGNAILEANTPIMDSLTANKKQYCDLGASGLDVGLPEGVMGNSEVGHLTMGFSLFLLENGAMETFIFIKLVVS
ncbi:hypothetical protein MHBO_002065 [Bonamia ostreae]|uniref:Metalloenzyme domain-containing protein n=1 Tax=Bonamia ostreae TaxID=126728 RepID=A0ABV2AL37_9EUKA